jgi:hypothetical protein
MRIKENLMDSLDFVHYKMKRPLYIDFEMKATIMDSLNVYVGAEIEQMLATKVLEHSILKHASVPVQVKPLFQAIAEAKVEIPPLKSKQQGNRTPFSFQRFAIPELNSHRGRAVYVDSDMLVFKDIAELKNWPFDGSGLLYCKLPAGSKRRPQFSVMVLDCESLGWKVKSIVSDLDQGRWSYEELMYKMAACPNPSQSLPAEWNCLEYYESGKSALVHFTDMLEQPWLDTVSPLTELWSTALIDAVRSGFITKAFVDDEIHKGWVRPSIAYQIERSEPNPDKLPRDIIAADRRNFVSPPEHASFLKVFTGYGNPRPSNSAILARKFYASTRTSIRRGAMANAIKSARNALLRV